MSIIDTLVTDRTEQDLENLERLAAKGWDAMTAEEKSYWESAAGKGAYNASDLNRVGLAVTYLHDELLESGYLIPGYTEPKTDWYAEDDAHSGLENIPTEQRMADYLGNVAGIKAAISAAQEIPANMEYLDIDGANNIEKLLVETDSRIDRMRRAMMLYSGMAWSGQIFGEFTPT
ncbi:MAG: hypothetical protein IJ705_02945 [Oscillospiraceae bacterium]|nr:hypothetical protein [Oscillospiraceae bacterium]